MEGEPSKKAIAMPHYLLLIAVSGTAAAIVALVYAVIDRARRADQSELAARQLRVQVDAQSHWARRLASIIDASNDAVIDVSLDGTIQTWNPAAESLFGYRAQAAMGRNVSLLIPSAQLAEHKAIMQRVAAGQRIDHVVTERDCADRGPMVIAQTLLPVRNNQGHVVGASIIAREMPPAPAAPGPKLVNGAGARHPERPAPIQNEVAELNDVLFDFARLIQGRTRLRRHRLWFGPLVDHAAERIRGRCKAAVVVDLPTEPLAIDGDKDRLLEIVTKLLTLASEFTDGSKQIHIQLTREEDTAVLIVRDNGVGIAPEHLPHVFDMFNHAPWSVTGSPRINAAGMALLRLLVQLHNGSIKVESDGPGRGMAFRLSLPLARTVGPIAVVSAY